jgi:hypothetical protein
LNETALPELPAFSQTDKSIVLLVENVLGEEGVVYVCHNERGYFRVIGPKISKATKAIQSALGVP